MRTHTIKITEKQRHTIATWLRHSLLTNGHLLEDADVDELTKIAALFESANIPGPVLRIDGVVNLTEGEIE